MFFSGISFWPKFRSRLCQKTRFGLLVAELAKPQDLECWGFASSAASHPFSQCEFSDKAQIALELNQRFSDGTAGVASPLPAVHTSYESSNLARHEETSDVYHSP